MRTRTHGIRWRRVVVWWVCLSFVLWATIIGGLVGAAWWLHRAQPMSGTTAVRLEDNSARCAPRFNFRMNMDALGPALVRADGTDVYYLGTRTGRVKPVWNEPDDLMRAEYLRSNVPPSLVPTALRLRNCLGWILVHDRHWFQSERRAMDIRIVVPVGVVVSSHKPISIPVELTAMYPIAFRVDAGRAVVFVPVWNVLWVGASGSGLLVTLGMTSFAARRRVRWKRGRCTACGYSLVGIAVDAPCPECGGER